MIFLVESLAYTKYCSRLIRFDMTRPNTVFGSAPDDIQKKTNTIICNAHKCAFDVGILQVFLSIWLVYCSLFFFSYLFSRFIVILNSCRYIFNCMRKYLSVKLLATHVRLSIHNSNESFRTIHQSVVCLLCIAENLEQNFILLWCACVNASIRSSSFSK